MEIKLKHPNLALTHFQDINITKKKWKFFQGSRSEGLMFCYLFFFKGVGGGDERGSDYKPQFSDIIAHGPSSNQTITYIRKLLAVSFTADALG